MNRSEMRRVDLNMLIVFETLMHERNLTRTAEKLFLGQPAISAALSRLRDYFNDPCSCAVAAPWNPPPARWKSSSNCARRWTPCPTP